MKRFISMVLLVMILGCNISAIALDTEVKYPDVNITLLSDNPDEQEFRQWAARVIDSYYTGYCQHDSNNGQYYAVDFPSSIVEQFWNKLWGSGDYIDLDLSAIGQFDGIYKSYYFASLAKLDSDYNKRKAIYAIVRTQNETDEQYVNKMKAFYMMLLVDVMDDEGIINMDNLDSISPSKIGKYTLRDNGNGEMTMQFVEGGQMDTLDQIGRVEAEKAWCNFGTSMINTAIQGAITYLKINEGDSTESGIKLADSYAKAAGEAVVKIIDRGANSLFEREKSKLKNNLREAVRCNIANRELRDYNRTMAYLKNVYSEPGFLIYQNDPVFIEAVLNPIFKMQPPDATTHQSSIVSLLPTNATLGR